MPSPAGVPGRPAGTAALCPCRTLPLAGPEDSWWPADPSHHLFPHGQPGSICNKRHLCSSNNINNYASTAPFRPWRYFLEPVKSRWQFWQFFVTSPAKGDRRPGVIYSWPSGRSHRPELKPSKEVLSGMSSICTWHREESFAFVRLMWNFGG